MSGNLFMRNVLFVTAISAVAVFSECQSCAQSTAPLHLFVNGSGSISPFIDGQMLNIGQNYEMTAIPDAGSVFSSWQPVNVFTFTNITINPDGSTNPPTISVVPSLVPAYTNQASLDFTMQPVTVLTSTPSLTITESTGWQANFASVILSIQLSDSAVILTWTNLSYNLQAAPTPFADFTNVPNATSPYTNSISGPELFFRLVSN